MRRLELRIPPPALAALAALAMWLVARALPALQIMVPGRAFLAVAIAVIGGLISLAGVIEFRRAGTTVNPLNPSAASSLVVKGVYGLSRNPMYLGLVTLLTGWAVFLSHPVSLLVLPCFTGYMNRFQILPEERALEALFGAEFKRYSGAVRRWL